MRDKVQNITLDKFSTVDGIFHLAAQASVPYSIENFYNSSKNNILGSLKIFDWAKELEIPVVFASSSAIYGNLSLGDDSKSNYEILSPYALDKLTMEGYASMMFNVYDIKSIGLRFFNVYGPNQDPSNPYSGVISIFIDRILKGKTITVNGGYQTRDFVYVDDIVDVMLTSMHLLHESDICEFFNVGTGKSTSVDVLLNTIKDILNADPRIIKKELPKGDPEKSEGTYEKIIEILNIDLANFVTLETGLHKTIKSLLV
jgi:UDP-glucose 4-epimerase